MSNVETQGREVATFGAGCFWGVEETFRTTDGVIETAVGYAGGTTENPTYKEVCSGRTGHAEVVQVIFDPEQIGYGDLLDLFWKVHDPTQLNRQGPDRGTQYRSVIFTHSAEQREAATASKSEQESSGIHSDPVVTAIEEAGPFYRAEEYHQQYIMKRGGGCRVWGM